jgi:hypothetical protein
VRPIGTRRGPHERRVQVFRCEGAGVHQRAQGPGALVEHRLLKLSAEKRAPHTSFVVRGVYGPRRGTIPLAREKLDITTIHQELLARR